MFVYCGNNPVNRFDPTGEFFITATLVSGYTIFQIGAALICTVAIGGATYKITETLVENPPTFPSISLPKIGAQPKTKEKGKDIAIPADPPEKDKGRTYYHSTTRENAMLIKATGRMIGSKWEGGRIYAWRSIPSKNAVANSGARTGAIISFKTNAPFMRDANLDGRLAVSLYRPVVSVFSGPINVWDVQIVRWD